MNADLMEAIKKMTKNIFPEKENLSMEVVQKSEDGEKRLFYAIVLEPMTDVTDEGDTHGHVMKAEEIEKSAHYFMQMGATVFGQHTAKVEAVVVESYIAPVDFIVEGTEKSETIKKGSWVMAVKVKDDDMWKSIKNGDITAFSPGGFGILEDLE